MFIHYFAKNISLKEFQLLCEQEYGSSLEWFFQQYLYRSTIPEFVLQWKTEKNVRGNFNVTVTIDQRGDRFTMPLSLLFTFGSRPLVKQIFVEQQQQIFTFLFSSSPTRIELDPNYTVLQWILDLRILAHAHTSRLFRVFNKDVSTSEREALLTLQLDPNNNTGAAPIALFSLGKLAVIENNLEKAKEYFLQAMQVTAVDEAQLYSLLGLVRYANILEMEGDRDEAVKLYQRAISEGEKNPAVFAPAIIEAGKYLHNKFISSDALWYGVY